MKVSRANVAVALLIIAAGAVGFGAGAILRGPTSLGYLSNVGTILVAAIPALAAYVRSGKIQNETTEIRASVEQVRQQTNGATSNLMDVASRAVDALAAIAQDPGTSQRAAGLIRAIESSLPDQTRDADTPAYAPTGEPPAPSAIVTPR